MAIDSDPPSMVQGATVILAIRGVVTVDSVVIKSLPSPILCPTKNHTNDLAFQHLDCYPTLFQIHEKHT